MTLLLTLLAGALAGPVAAALLRLPLGFWTHAVLGVAGAFGGWAVLAQPEVLRMAARAGDSDGAAVAMHLAAGAAGAAGLAGALAILRAALRR